MPKSKRFSVGSVCDLVGKNRNIHVQCCQTQTTIKMTMAKFTAYFQSNVRDEVYNVLSLEFTDTDMDKLVKRPKVVDLLDWATLSYPTYLTDVHKKGAKRYPKIQKYCLMSVGGSYTSFHIDFGGTSVWYHVLKGRKVFWLIPPTDLNIELFTAWSSQDNQDQTFFGDLVEHCQRVILEAGTTFMIPSGWIHAVYTPVDSLVFGGNFVHSYSVGMQMKIADLEIKLDIQQEMRFPLMNELKWYVVERYARYLGGKSYLKQPPTINVQDGSRLCEREAEGLSLLLHSLHAGRFTDVVEGITNLPKLHEAALRLLEISGVSSVSLPDRLEFTLPRINVARKVPVFKKYTATVKLEPAAAESSQDSDLVQRKIKKNIQKVTLGTQLTANTVKPMGSRLVRCWECIPCTTEECLKCSYCVDMIKHGGPNRFKKACKKRKCANPQPAKGRVAKPSKRKLSKEPALLSAAKEMISENSNEKNVAEEENVLMSLRKA